MLTDSLLACVGKRVNLVIGHRTSRRLRDVTLLSARENFIEVGARDHAQRVPLTQVRSIEVVN